MRLLDTGSLEITEFSPTKIKPYAILSHTWGEDEHEATYEDFRTGNARNRLGFRKIEGACTQAKRDGLDYVWVDTCCIDKSSSAELSEAINSMYRWYEDAAVCYIYLSDVKSSFVYQLENVPKEFLNSRWFTRGWTLQEIIAPRTAIFFTKGWDRIGSRYELREILVKITGIDYAVFLGQESVENAVGTVRVTPGILGAFSIAQKMAWASKRQSTRVEDMAYSLLGLFEVNMPLIYGEGGKAFVRLQEEIMKDSDDQSIFAWRLSYSVPRGLKHNVGLLANSPASFADSGHIVRPKESKSVAPYSITNKGLRIELPLISWQSHRQRYLASDPPSLPAYLTRFSPDYNNENLFAAPLDCSVLYGGGSKNFPIIWLERFPGGEEQYARAFPDKFAPVDFIRSLRTKSFFRKEIYVPRRPGGLTKIGYGRNQDLNDLLATSADHTQPSSMSLTDTLISKLPLTDSLKRSF